MTKDTAIGLDTGFLNFLLEKNNREELWIAFLSGISARRIAEIGVWKGEFTSLILKNCSDIDQYYMVDSWRNLPNWNKPYNVSQSEFDTIYQAAMNNTACFSHKRVVLSDETKIATTKIQNGSLDFAYIDGDHTLRGIVVDLLNILPKISPGGYIGGDDFTSNPWQHSSLYEPSLVCPFAVHFAEAADLPIIALPNSQFLIRNLPDAGFSFIDYTGSYGDLSLANIKREGRLKSIINRLLPWRKGRYPGL